MHDFYEKCRNEIGHHERICLSKFVPKTGPGALLMTISTIFVSQLSRKPRCTLLIYNAVRQVRFRQAWSLGSKFRACIGFKKAAHRTTEGTHWNALFRWSWNTRTKPGGHTRCSLDPVADATKFRPLKVGNEPLHHLAVALWTLNRFRIHAQTFVEGIGRYCHRLNIFFYCQY